MVARARTTLALALAISATAACGAGYYLGSDAGGGGGGSNSGATSGSVAGAASGNPVGISGNESGGVGFGGGSGATFGSGVAEGAAGSPFGSGVMAGFGSGTATGFPFGSGVTAGFPFGSGAATGSAFGGESGMVLPSGSSGSVAPADASVFCKVPDINAGSLPFVVDTAFVPSGWMGDAPAYEAMPANPLTGTPASPATTARITLVPRGYSMIGDACTPDGVDRSSPNAKGACWKVTFVPFPKSIQPGVTGTKIGGGPGYGWAGAFWQHPANNWGTLGGGYPIPPGASTVSFWARGTDGGEKVRFFTGEGLSTPCSDYVATASTNAILSDPPAWQRYTIDITGLDYSSSGITPGQGLGGYYGGVLGAFGFAVGAQTLPSLNGGSAPPNETDPNSAPVADPAVPNALFPPFFDSTITFYIDDIEFQ